MPYDLPAEHVLPVLASHDRTQALDARSAWDWLTASGEVPVITLRDLEYFLWYQLPAKFLTGHAHHRAVALALGDLLSDLGYADGAALCRGPVTMHVLEEWEKGPGSGHRALRKCLDESGVEPPDTDTLAWGGVMGEIEATVFATASSVLERALAERAFTPGARGWRRAQAAVLHRFLTTPLHSLDESSPQAAVWAERAKAWADEHLRRPRRKELVEDVRDQIRRPRRAPEAAADCLRPLTRFLEIAGTNPVLTQAGYLPPATVKSYVQEFGWEDSRPPRSEADAYVVQLLSAFAKQAALIRRTRVTLRLTEIGRRAVVDPAVLWERVARTLAIGDDFASAIRELVLIKLLNGPGERTSIEEEVHTVLAEAGWRPADARGLTRDMVSFRLWDAIRPMDRLSIVDVGDWPDRSLRLTGFGAETTRAILWHRATAPRQGLG